MAGAKEGNAATQVVLAACSAACLPLALYHRDRLLALLRSAWPLLLFTLWVACSAMWSDSPDFTIRRTIRFALFLWIAFATTASIGSVRLFANSIISVITIVIFIDMLSIVLTPYHGMRRTGLQASTKVKTLQDPCLALRLSPLVVPQWRANLLSTSADGWLCWLVPHFTLLDRMQDLFWHRHDDPGRLHHFLLRLSQSSLLSTPGPRNGRYVRRLRGRTDSNYGVVHGRRPAATVRRSDLDRANRHLGARDRAHRTATASRVWLDGLLGAHQANPFADVPLTSWISNVYYLNSGHNGYLDTMLEAGVIGLALTILIICRALWIYGKLLRLPWLDYRQPRLVATLLGIVLCLLVNNTLESLLFRSGRYLSDLFIFIYLAGELQYLLNDSGVHRHLRT